MSDIEQDIVNPTRNDTQQTFQSLTIWTNALSMQVRDSEVAVHIMEDARRSSEDGHPALLTLDEARLVRDLLNMATARGFL